MDDQEFQDKMVNERIAMLFGMRDAEQELMRDYDSVLEGLEHPVEQRIRTQINRMINQMIETEREAYYAGVKDGIKLAKWVHQL